MCLHIYGGASKIQVKYMHSAGYWGDSTDDLSNAFFHSDTRLNRFIIY